MAEEARRCALLGDPTRPTLLLAIYHARPISLSDLAVADGMHDTTVSPGLRILRAATMVSIAIHRADSACATMVNSRYRCFGEDPDMSTLLLADEREAVASASRHLSEQGLVIGTAGNISARQGDLVAVTPTGADLATVTAEMVTVIDLAGEIVDGDLAPTSEVPLHTGIYAATNALAITHAHAMASTALSCSHDELPPLHYSCLGLGGAPRTAPYATFGSQELADNVVEALQGRNAAMMQNHGSIAYGNSMKEAVERLELLEWLAELYWRAASLGTPRVLTDKDFEAIIVSAMERGYGTMKKVDKG